MDDLNKWHRGARPWEQNLLKSMRGDLGSPGANWARNEYVLKQAMSRGKPFRDASVNRLTGTLRHIGDNSFLNRERNFLRLNHWNYNHFTHKWYPPKW